MIWVNFEDTQAAWSLLAKYAHQCFYLTYSSYQLTHEEEEDLTNMLDKAHTCKAAKSNLITNE